MDSPYSYPDSPLDFDEAAYPCKGCGEILEEGKAFELAGNRWHIDCFRCNTCSTLLDSDANLLLLGDGSLICNNCTYSCSNCGNKIEDLAILTGDQAFCANCFKCRNCKKKIENLRYARTSQGIFCMDCHEALMARRRKKTARNAAQRQKLSANNSSHLDKSLPSLPPPEARKTVFVPDTDSVPSDTFSESSTKVPSVMGSADEEQNKSSIDRRDGSLAPQNYSRDGLNLPTATIQNNRQSMLSQRSDMSGGEEFLIPVAFDPTPPAMQSPQSSNQGTPRLSERARDYFGGRSVSSTHREPTTQRSVKSSSPHIAYQEKGRQASLEAADTLHRRKEAPGDLSGFGTTSSPVSQDRFPRSQEESPNLSQLTRETSIRGEHFKLQDAPKTRQSAGSSPEVLSGANTPRNGAGNEIPGRLVSQDVADNRSDPLMSQDNITPKASHEADSTPNGTSDTLKPKQHLAAGVLQNLPKRGDSLESVKRGQTIPRKELNPAANIPQVFSDVLSNATSNPPSTSAELSTKVNGGKVISNPIESPTSKSILDTPSAVQTTGDDGTEGVSKESFIAPRAPPIPPNDAARSRNESTSTNQTEAQRMTEFPSSPGLPRYSAGGEFSMDEDMARILGGEEPLGHESFLKRVSNSVRHGRSFSDKGTIRLSREQRWPRSPVGPGSMSGQEISSPSTASPENRDELAWFRNELRRERQKTIEREKKITELEAALDSTTNIKQVNSELREKRSTMVVLDTQKEIVIRELEVLTEHIAAAKKSGDPLDMGKLSSAVLRDFAEALQKLKDSFAPQIEDSVQKRNDLVDEIAQLTQMKDKSFQEFEQLSSKNAQLAELNNQLVHQIQELYKANATSSEAGRAPNGLGIYSHHKDKSQISIDSRDARTAATDFSVPSSSTTLQPDEAESAAIMQGPHVVSIRKGQPKKFTWKGKGQNVAKGVTKGLKGAFSSTQQNYNKELQFTETAPYSVTPPGQEYSTLPRNNQEPIKGSFGFFGNNQKLAPKTNGLNKGSANGSTPSLVLDPSTHLYGSDLEQRADYEKTTIPAIVLRCIEEVETRGMDVEGIYRKSGGNSQVQLVRDGFERSPLDFDISDPDLDIHAVTSGLKQYFRRLPIPLITYDVYDRLLETTTIIDHDKRVEAVHSALIELPKVHSDVLEFLMSHLGRVVEREKENLMSNGNIAVVFAPTLMRPEKLEREMAEMSKGKDIMQFLVEFAPECFGRPAS